MEVRPWHATITSICSIFEKPTKTLMPINLWNHACVQPSAWNAPVAPRPFFPCAFLRGGGHGIQPTERKRERRPR